MPVSKTWKEIYLEAIERMNSKQRSEPGLIEQQIIVSQKLNIALANQERAMFNSIYQGGT